MKKIIISYLLFQSSFSLASLSAEAVANCLKEDFSVAVSRPVFPLGYFSKNLKLTKKKCEITIRYESYRWIKSGWVIDVCREPLHIKSGIKSFKVIKKNKACPAQDSPYCQEFQKMMTIIEDDGLIFAAGEKENFNSEHGKLYCLYALIHKYLSGEEILSRYRQPKPYLYTEGVIQDYHVLRRLDGHKKSDRESEETESALKEGTVLEEDKKEESLPVLSSPKKPEKI